MDIWVASNLDNAKKCVVVLQRFGMDVPEAVPELFLRANAIIRLGLPPVRIEIHTAISGVTFDDCFSRKRRINFGDMEINIFDIDDLKRNKKAAGRHRDLEDLQHLPPSDS